MMILGTVAFGAMTAVNLTVLAAVVIALCRRTRAHH
jgi:hypothetical protein